MRILFFGTSAFAVSILRCLIDSEYEMVGVVTQPDKPTGRGRKIVSPPVKEIAERSGISVFQPVRCKDPDFINTARSLEPDFLVVAAYGQILPKDLLAVPRQIPVNVHASLLPCYRGAAPIQWAIINGEKTTGVTTMAMDIGMDTGDVLLTAKTQIKQKETAGSLHDRLAEMGGELLIQTLNRWLEGSVVRLPQQHSQATYAPALKKEDGHIRWEESGLVIERKIRGLTPWPGAYGILNGKRMKILEADFLDQATSALPGTIVRAADGVFSVACTDGILSILRLQAEGKRPVMAREFLTGLRCSLEGENFI